MNDTTERIVFEHLCHIRWRDRRTARRAAETRERLATVESQIVSLRRDFPELMARVAMINRLDRVDDLLERIE